MELRRPMFTTSLSVWLVRQSADIEDLLDNDSDNVWVSIDGVTLVGRFGIRFAPR
jgi:hypothetical protein